MNITTEGTFENELIYLGFEEKVLTTSVFISDSSYKRWERYKKGL